MTQSEKKVTYSEIINPEEISEHSFLLKLGTFMYFSVLNTKRRFLLVSPIDGYLNLLLIAEPYQCTVHAGEHTVLLHTGENLIIHLKKGDLIEIKSIAGDNQLLFLLIPEVNVLPFHQKYFNDPERFKNGLVTQADHRISLASKQIIELSAVDAPLLQLKIQSLLLEIIYHQIEGLFAENDNKEIIANKNHYDKIVLAKKIIEEDLTRNYSISELSKLVGTNEQYLKKYFKQYYGKTIMNYMTDVKMEHAKKLIMDGKLRIADVAQLTGYKHSTHFTTAFKKYFGIIPNSLRYTFLVAHEGVELLPELAHILTL